jgi:hypothetical protein
MTRRIVLLAAAATLMMAQGAWADQGGWWGRKLPGEPTNFIFGYGSLINSLSRNATAASPILAIPVRVSADFGWIRAWNFRSQSGFTALGLRKPNEGEHSTTINGVLYPVEGTDMARFDEREVGYRRLEVPPSQIEAVGWQPLPTVGHFWLYVPEERGKIGEVNGVGPAKPDRDFPLLESYIDVFVEGGLEYGKEYARELIETTQGWSPYWLNDRVLARRPWVRDPQSQTVDELLQSTTVTSALLRERRFPETYAEKWFSPTVPAATK